MRPELHDMDLLARLGRDRGWLVDDRHGDASRAPPPDGARILLVQETGEPDVWPCDRALPWTVEYATRLDGQDLNAFALSLIVSDRELAPRAANVVVYRPKSLVIGLGCQRGTPAHSIARGIDHALREHRLSVRSVRGLASIDTKRDEPGLLALSAERGWPLALYAAEALDRVSDLAQPSQRVHAHAGTRGVAEPAARLAAGAATLIAPKTVYSEASGHKLTIAVARVPFAPLSAGEAR